jgi:hypothetical protein
MGGLHSEHRGRHLGTSRKQQAASSKQQAASSNSKQQAASSKQQAASISTCIVVFIWPRWQTGVMQKESLV